MKETTAATNCFGPLNITTANGLPPAPGRHSGGLNVIYADGHVK
ncbi:MAG: hypothetical protein HY318_00120 [Armatimonadetes bacterium]|nr:hypothetical protein [Armatimonadota bacterium]